MFRGLFCVSNYWPSFKQAPYNIIYYHETVRFSMVYTDEDEKRIPANCGVTLVSLDIQLHSLSKCTELTTFHGLPAGSRDAETTWEMHKDRQLQKRMLVTVVNPYFDGLQNCFTWQGPRLKTTKNVKYFACFTKNELHSWKGKKRVQNSHTIGGQGSLTIIMRYSGIINTVYQPAESGYPLDDYVPPAVAGSKKNSTWKVIQDASSRHRKISSHFRVEIKGYVPYLTVILPRLNSAVLYWHGINSYLTPRTCPGTSTRTQT
jgi:hypothetical protein